MAHRDGIPGRRTVPLGDRNRILHVDMDSFFVSIERALDPRLLGKPVLVGGDPAGRGVIVACSYEARRFGVRSGMPTARALSLCRDAIVLPSRPGVYTQIAAGILRILCRHSDRVEPTSVDESYLDLADECADWEEVGLLAGKIRAAVRSAYGIAASAGAGPSKMVAKIASRLAKPDGVRIIPGDRVKEVVHPLPVTAMGGVGEKTASSLRMFGIATVGDLAGADETLIHKRFGKNGSLLSRLARGEEDFPVVPFRAGPDPCSMSNERTLARDTDDPETIDTVLLSLSEKLARRLRTEGFAGNVFEIKIRFSDYRTILRSRTLPERTRDERTLFLLAREWARRFGEGRPLRLVGVGLAGLARVPSIGGELDLDPSRGRYLGALGVFDAVRDRFGERSLRKARLL
ncbi:MAG: DNA polymerase IV [Candidatus Eisenbacteria bacterium]